MMGRAMARTKAMLGTGARLADYLGASLLARVVPAEVVNEVLDAHGRNSQRLRSFPAVVGVYYCIALSLYPEAAYEEVFAAVAQGLAWAAGAAEPTRVSKVSISLARSKIGAAPLQDLVRRCCVPMAEEKFHPEAFYRGMRLVAMDGSNFELPDESDNEAYFGRPGSRTGVAGYPGWRQLPCPVDDNYLGRFDAIAGQVCEAGYCEPIELKRRLTFCPARRSRTTKCRNTNNTVSSSARSPPRPRPG